MVMWLNRSVEKVASVRLMPWTALIASAAVKVRDFLVRSMPVPARLCTGLSLTPNDKCVTVLDANAQVLGETTGKQPGAVDSSLVLQRPTSLTESECALSALG